MSAKTYSLIEITQIRSLSSQNLRAHVGLDKILVVVIEFGKFLPETKVLSDLLSAYEKDKCRSFIKEELRLKYIVSHGIMRLLLSEIMGTSPKFLVFDTTTHGKPFLKKATNAFDLRFNLSHSNNYAALAFSRGCELGIDIEEDHAYLRVLEIAKLVLAQSELQELISRPANEQKPAFLKLWTQKEALSKALGTGLSMNFQELILGTGGNDNNYKNMLIFDLSKSPLFYASLATER